MKIKIKVPQKKFDEALIKLRSAGEVSFDGNAGSFDVSGVEGRFLYDEDASGLTIVIDDKPFFASDSMIEKKIREFFN